MKTLYITTFLLAGIISLHAQENKTVEKQDDIKAIKDVKALEAKIMQKQDNKKAEIKSTQLLSEQNLVQQKSIPNQKANSKSIITKQSPSIKDLPSAAILEK